MFLKFDIIRRYLTQKSRAGITPHLALLISFQLSFLPSNDPLPHVPHSPVPQRHLPAFPSP